MAKLKGERHYVLVLRPDHKRIVSEVQDMSLALVRDGMTANIAILADKGERINWTADEKAEFNVPDDVNFGG